MEVQEGRRQAADEMTGRLSGQSPAGQCWGLQGAAAKVRLCQFGPAGHLDVVTWPPAARCCGGGLSVYSASAYLHCRTCSSAQDVRK
jgi:hypothetical protein